ncbi:MAG TPA: transposase [Candidatus Acidoferrales bacterium]|nr:transposase [Candidatus Acidoferrales bacterium]
MGKLTHRTAPGCSYFVTTKTWQSREIFCVKENAEILVECILNYRDGGAYLLHEFVVMPNHLHLLLTPTDGTSLEKAIQLIKGGSSHQTHQQRGHKMQIWQPGFHESTVRDADDFQARRLYIHNNPVAAHLVPEPAGWLYSSASGRFPLNSAPEPLSSGAKALFAAGGYVGAKAPTP